MCIYEAPFQIQSTRVAIYKCCSYKVTFKKFKCLSTDVKWILTIYMVCNGWL